MFRIFQIIKKNFKLLIRNKTSALVIILGPLLLIFLVGFGFSSSAAYELRLAYYTPEKSELTNALIAQLQEKFNVFETETNESCIEGVKKAEYHVCAIIPGNLQITSKENITFYVDYSRVNLVYYIIETFSEQLQIKEEEISKELASDLLQKITTANIKLTGKKSSLSATKSNTETLISNLNSLNSKLSSIDLDYGNLTSEISSVEEQENVSLSSLKSKIEDIQDKIDTAKSKISESINLISTSKTLSQENKNALESIITTVNEITADFSALEVKEAEQIASPIKLKIQPIITKAAHLNYLFPAMLVIVVMLISILIASMLIINEKTTFAYFRNFITPTSDSLHIFGNFFSSLVFTFIEIIVIVAVASALFFKDMLAQIGISLGILVLGSSVFLFIGMIIGYLFNSSETANLASLSIASIFLFFSNVILPLEALPKTFAKIMYFNPFVLLESVLRKILLFGYSVKDIYFQLVIIASYAITLAILTIIACKVTKRRLIMK